MFTFTRPASLIVVALLSAVFIFAIRGLRQAEAAG